MLKLYAHPLSSYCWKVTIALAEAGAAYEPLELGPDFPEHNMAFGTLWPLGKMPLLVDGERPIAESSVIIEYVDARAESGPKLVPAGEAGLRVRFLDRVFDHYVMTPMQQIVGDRLRPEGQADALGVERARGLIGRSYDWLERELGDDWAAGEGFTLADCAAFPALFYADKVRPMGPEHGTVRAYLDRLLARPSVRGGLGGCAALLAHVSVRERMRPA